MIITKSNILLGRTPSVSNGVNTDLNPANITDPDFSTFYQSTDNNRLTLDFGATGIINYVAFAGTNIATETDFNSRFSVFNGETVIARTFVKYNNCCVVTFPAQAFSNLRIGMLNSTGSARPIVRFVAAGTAFSIPNGGENAGYNRQFLNRNKKTKSTLSDLAAPTSVLTKKVAANGTLTLPNMTKDFSENEWQDFLNFSEDNYFFIREQDPIQSAQASGEIRSNNNSAYLCYEVTGTNVKAHSQTRLLNDISFKFKVFNGL